MAKIDKAIAYAAKKHEGQKRKGFNQSYMYHPLEVLSLASILTSDEDIWCAAVLHDTVEDTDATALEIEELFGENVARMVHDETEDKRSDRPKSETWEIRKQESIDHVKNLKEIGPKIICLCDKVSNLRSLHLLQFDKGDDLWNIFNMKDPKKHYWYYNSLKEALSELKDYSVYKEYEFLINTIFDKYI